MEYGVKSKIECGGRDSNPRTPTGVDLESTAFGLARQPPLQVLLIFENLFKGFTVDVNNTTGNKPLKNLRIVNF